MTPKESRQFDMSRIIDIAVSGLLLATALLKALSPSIALSASAMFGVGFWHMVALVQIELLVAGLLFSGWRQHRTRLIAIGLFVLFAGFSLAMALQGHASCGCFGPIKTNPWAIFALDVAVVAALTWTAKFNQQENLSYRRHASLLACGSAICAVFAFFIMISNRPVSLGSQSLVDATAEIVILEPESWIGKEFPLAAHVVPKVSFDAEKTSVLVYHHDCPDCQKALPRFVEMARALGERKIVLIEVPPLGNPQEYGQATHTSLNQGTDWFVQAPVEIVLTNGVVASVRKPE